MEKKTFTKNAKLILLLTIFASCKSEVFYYDTASMNLEVYGLKKNNEITYYMPESKNNLYSFDWSEGIDIDSLLNKMNEEITDMPHASIAYSMLVNVVDSGIILHYQNQIDTLKVNEKGLQQNKKLPLPRQVFSIFNYSNKTRLQTYSRNYDVKYVKDSITYYNNSPMEKTHIFHFYPNTYFDRDTIKSIDTTKYINPVKVGFSSISGAIVYIKAIRSYNNRNTVELYCRDKKIIKLKSMKTLKTILH